MDFMSDKSGNLNKRLKITEIQTAKIKYTKENLEKIKSFHEFALKHNKATNLHKFISDYSKTQERLNIISQKMVQQGIIKNQEAVFHAVKNLGILMTNLDTFTKIKVWDSLLSFQKNVEKTAEIYKSSMIPHMNLYRKIIGAIDENVYDKIYSSVEEGFEDITDDSFDTDEKDINIVRPYFFDAAVKINIYVTVTMIMFKIMIM